MSSRPNREGGDYPSRSWFRRKKRPNRNEEALGKTYENTGLHLLGQRGERRSSHGNTEANLLTPVVPLAFGEKPQRRKPVR